jgi:hypothetical protein
VFRSCSAASGFLADTDDTTQALDYVEISLPSAQSQFCRVSAILLKTTVSRMYSNFLFTLPDREVDLTVWFQSLSNANISTEHGVYTLV